VLDEPRRERCDEHTSHQQRQRVTPVDAGGAQAHEEAERPADGHHELGGVDGAHDLARLDPARGQQGGGADRAPATAAEGVEGAADQSERDEEPGADPPAELGATAAECEEPVQDVQAQAEQDRPHDGLGDVGGEAGQQGGTGERPDRARHREDAHDPPVDVAESVVGDAGGEGGADLREVHGGRRGGGRDTGRDQQRRGRDAVGHAQGAVDELGDGADDAEHDECLHEYPSNSESIKSISTVDIKPKCCLDRPV